MHYQLACTIILISQARCCFFVFFLSLCLPISLFLILAGANQCCFCFGRPEVLATQIGRPEFEEKNKQMKLLYKLNNYSSSSTYCSLLSSYLLICWCLAHMYFGLKFGQQQSLLDKRFGKRFPFFKCANTMFMFIGLSTNKNPGICCVDPIC